MAESPAHKFGQIIGNVIEETVEPLLRRFAEENDLYLDKKGPRATRKGNKVSWTDSHGNKHDLDFVFERGGSGSRIGTPIAFIESAWRRYTKHSRNKAQEIQGAILELRRAYEHVSPFVGTILAGVFTDGALTQLRSLGFSVLYFPYESVVEAFRRVGVDARSDESTPDAEFARKVAAWEALRPAGRRLVGETLLQINAEEVERFMSELRRSVTRRIQSIVVLPLHGSPSELGSVEEAIRFIEGYAGNSPTPLRKFEVQIRYNNGDRIEGQFETKRDAIQFLRQFQSTPNA